jgi:hypothetical protein
MLKQYHVALLTRHVRTRITCQENASPSNVIRSCNPVVHDLISPAFQELWKLSGSSQLLVNPETSYIPAQSSLFLHIQGISC